MANLTKAQTNELRSILAALEAAQNYLMSAEVAVARKGSPATTALHYTRADGSTLYEVDKEIGSDLARLSTGVNKLARFIVAEGFRAR